MSTVSRDFPTPMMRFCILLLRSRIVCSSLPKSLRISSATRTTDANCLRILASVQFAIDVKSSSWVVFVTLLFDGCSVAVDCVGRDKNTGSTIR